MGRLGGFRYREIVKRLKRYGFEFDRQAADTRAQRVTSSSRITVTFFMGTEPGSQEFRVNLRAARMAVPFSLAADVLSSDLEDVVGTDLTRP